MLAWLHGHETLLWWVGALSILMFVGTLVALPLVVARLPADYFRRDHHATRHHTQSAVLRLLGLFGKNSARHRARLHGCRHVGVPWARLTDHAHWLDADQLPRQAGA